MITLGILSSCSGDFLDKQPIDQLTPENALNSPAAKNAFLAGAYSPMYFLWDHIYTWNYTIVGDIRSGNTYSGQDGGFDIVYADKFDSRPTDGQPVTLCYQQLYKYMAGANAVLDLKEYFTSEQLGQAYFLRALHYFYLVRYYGGVPLQLSNQVNPLTLTRSTEAEVYAQIEADLLLAEASLPLKYSSRMETAGRATKGAAQALLAKVYAQSGNYTNCAKFAGKVIDSGVYGLVPNYDFMFDDNPSHESSIEVIFEIQHVPSPQVGTFVEGLMLAHEVSGAGEWAKFNLISHDLAKAFKDEGDAVREASTMYWVTNRSTSNVYPSPEFTLTEPIPHSRKNGRIFTGWAGQSGHNVILLRLADIILLKAEALNKIGNTAEAITLLNQVRKRVSLPNTTAISQTSVALAILKERRLELALEGERFFDLIRFYGKQGTVDLLNSLKNGRGIIYKKATVDKLLLPIPQSEINSNPKITQNPGY